MSGFGRALDGAAAGLMLALGAAARRMVECARCGRLIPLPPEWHVVEYVCLRCRTEPERPA